MPSSPFEQPGGVGECIPRASVSIPTKGSCNPSEPDPISPPLHKMGGEMVDPQGRYPAPGTSSCAPGGPSYSTFGYESRGRGYPPLPAWAFNPGAGRQRQRKGEPENISYLYRRDGRGAENLPPVQKGGKTAKSGRISRISRKIPRRISRMRVPPPRPGNFTGTWMRHPISLEISQETHRGISRECGFGVQVPGGFLGGVSREIGRPRLREPPGEINCH